MRRPRSLSSVSVTAVAALSGLLGLAASVLFACGGAGEAPAKATPTDASVSAEAASPSPDGGAANCVVPLANASVTSFVDAIERAMVTGAPPGSNAVAIPDASTAASFVSLTAAILSGDSSEACALPTPYRAAKLVDPIAGPLWIVAEIAPSGAPAPSLYWGTFIATQGTSKRASWLVEAPHPYADSYTEHQAADLFVRVGARGLLVAGAHRCADAAEVSCSGTTTACGATASAYRVSDAAHSTEIPFLALHSALSTALGSPSFVQLHGNVEACPTALLSDGSGAWPDAGVLPALAAALAKGGIDAGLCGQGFPTTGCNLCGIDDLEGRASAGSADACNSNGASYGAMLHIEQQAAARTPDAGVYAQMLDAIDEALP